jgi:Zn-dependent protease
MMQLTLIQEIAVWAIPILFAITLHEAGHALCAYKLGDPTAKLLGRVTLNPLKHIDPIGTGIVPVALAIMTKFNFVFGWAKPVPMTPQNFKYPRRDTALVALAGPLANIIMCCLWALIMKFVLMGEPQKSMPLTFLFFAAKAGIIINLILFLLNMLPIPPLDGSRCVASLLPPKYSYYFMKVEPYGFFILIFLAVTNVLGYILSPLFSSSLSFIGRLFGLY